MDKYDKAIQHLRENPTVIHMAWMDPSGHPGGALFQFCGPRRDGCGCLTQIRADIGYRAVNPTLTRRIREDARLPERHSQITLSSLPVFAEWQRKLDKYAFRRKAVAQ